MQSPDSGSGQTAGLVIGCFIAVCLLITSLVLLIQELFFPKKNDVHPAPAPVDTGSLRTAKFHDPKPGWSDEQFRNSRFLRYYDATEKCPSTSTVIDSLLGLQSVRNRDHPIFHLINTEDHEYNVLKAYSSDIAFGSTTFFAYVNKELSGDDGRTLKKLMPFIRRATNQINNKGPSCNCVVYRGMKLDAKQRAYFTPGKVFRFPGFTSTSARDNMASDYGETLFEIQIPAGCQQVRDISDISCFGDEQEWLFSPYSRFRVLENTSDLIILQAIENME